MKKTIQEKIIIFFFTLISITTNPLANTIPNIQHPTHGLKVNETDYEALLAIKAEISNDPNSALSSWNNSLHFCHWKGITCSRMHRRVITLDLPSSNLVGTLSPFIGNLSFLHVLWLYNNSFHGEIPHQIYHLTRLQTLVLARNSFEGEIPANLSRCVHLSTLGLSYNKLVGRIPPEVASLPNVEVFDLTQNKLRGRLQDIGIGNMSDSLQELYFYDNHLHGSIPNDIGKLIGLGVLALGKNLLNSTIPTSLFNLSNLYDLDLSNARIHGHLPQNLGLSLPQLGYLSISDNSLTGPFPTSISNLSNLQFLMIQDNSFVGKFSLNGINLPYLSHLNIEFAFPLGEEARDLSFLDTLTNCTNLEYLLAGGYSSTGAFPHSILNLSTSLQVLGLESNQLSGQLPPGLGKFVNLYGLDLHDNHFTGAIPLDVGELKKMELLYFSYNNFSGEVPSSIGNMTRLSRLWLKYNNFEGSFPKSLGNCPNLEVISLSYNKLSGVLPVEVFRASSLFALWVRQNSLTGSLPIEIISLKNLVELDISQNMFSGEIPSALGGCTSLTTLDLNRNSFVGSIPESLSPLKSIQSLDLSYNNLSGQIPSYLSFWPYLFSLNLSFNALEGEVPIIGVFANMSDVSVVGNSKLCGGLLQLHLPKCAAQRKPKRRRLSLAMVVIISIVCGLSIMILVVALCFYFFCSSRKRKDVSSELQNIRPFLEVSYQMLSRATKGFCSSNLIGVGAFGSVYKGILRQDETELVVAVKVMNLHNEGASKSFIAECKTLRNIRHRNLIKIITACSSIDTHRNDFKSLVYEFMPKGSLDDWIHSSLVVDEHAGDDQSGTLSLFQRLSIAIDVACALEYLHIECASSIIHCDLKPTNILLDEEMTAHVSDFGLAKFLSGSLPSSNASETSSTRVRGTVGYTAPEYGLGSKASAEGDIYSFGIVVLEMMTSKKPTDSMFSEGLNLHDFVKSAFPHRVMEIMDQRMLGDANVLRPIIGADMRKIECIKSLIMVGVKCSLEVPQDRMSINDVVNELTSVRQNILCRGT